MLSQYLGSNAGSKLAGDSAIWKVGDLNKNLDFGSSGFSALPSCFRSISGAFYGLGAHCFYWSGTETSSDSARSRDIYYGRSDLSSIIGNKLNGSSVRCIKN